MSTRVGYATVACPGCGVVHTLPVDLASVALGHDWTRVEFDPALAAHTCPGFTDPERETR